MPGDCFMNSFTMARTISRLEYLPSPFSDMKMRPFKSSLVYSISTGRTLGCTASSVVLSTTLGRFSKMSLPTNFARNWTYLKNLSALAFCMTLMWGLFGVCVFSERSYEFISHAFLYARHSRYCTSVLLNEPSLAKNTITSSQKSFLARCCTILFVKSSVSPIYALREFLFVRI